MCIRTSPTDSRRTHYRFAGKLGTEEEFNKAQQQCTTQSRAFLLMLWLNAPPSDIHEILWLFPPGTRERPYAAQPKNNTPRTVTPLSSSPTLHRPFDPAGITSDLQAPWCISPPQSSPSSWTNLVHVQKVLPRSYERTQSGGEFDWSWYQLSDLRIDQWGSNTSCTTRWADGRLEDGKHARESLGGRQVGQEQGQTLVTTFEYLGAWFYFWSFDKNKCLQAYLVTGSESVCLLKRTTGFGRFCWVKREKWTDHI